MTFGNLYFSKIIKLVRLKGYVEGFHVFYLITFAFSQKKLALLQFKPNIEMHSHTFNQLCILKRSASKYALNFYLFTHLCNWKNVPSLRVKFQLYTYMNRLSQSIEMSLQSKCNFKISNRNATALVLQHNQQIATEIVSLTSQFFSTRGFSRESTPRLYLPFFP